MDVTERSLFNENESEVYTHFSLVIYFNTCNCCICFQLRSLEDKLNSIRKHMVLFENDTEEAITLLERVFYCNIALPVDQYTILEAIGSGEFGTVYQVAVCDNRHNKAALCAVKV